MTAFLMDPAPLQPLQPLQPNKGRNKTKSKSKSKSKGKGRKSEGFEGFGQENEEGPKPFDPVNEYRALLDLTEDSRRGGRERKRLTSRCLTFDVSSRIIGQSLDGPSSKTTLPTSSACSG